MATAAIGKTSVSTSAKAMVALLGLMVFINYVDRGNLATAGPLIKTEMGLSNTQFGLLVSAFFWTYTPAQLGAGWLAQRYDTHRVLAVGLAIWALATIAMGFAGGFVALLALRIVLGLGESVAFPSCSKLIAEHLPTELYGRANAVTAVGLSIGPAFGIYAGGLLIAWQGWRPSFILFGAVSLLWLIPWLMQRRDAVPPHRPTDPAPPFREIVQNRAAWGAALGHFCINYAFYFILAWLPLYLVKVHGFSLAQMATLGGLIYLLQAVGAISFGMLSDHWIERGASPNRARKTMMVGGTLVTGCCMIAVATGGPLTALVALLASGLFGGMTASNCYATGQTLAGPCAAGKFVGFQNFVGNIAGIIAPALTGYLVDTTGGYSAAFAVAAATSVAGAYFWGILAGRIEPVAWTRPVARAEACPIMDDRARILRQPARG